MEFHEKLQQLRKQKGLTQEEAAERLFVSRAAVSKWESGRGYPNIDSLKAIANFYAISIDDLLSGEEMLTLAEEDTNQKQSRLHDLVFGLLDISTVLLLFLPFFAQDAAGAIQAVPLLSLKEIAPYLKTAYFSFAAANILFGLLTFTLQTCHHAFWAQNKRRLSVLINMAGVLLFIVSLQPYAAVYLFVFLVIKALILIKKP